MPLPPADTDREPLHHRSIDLRGWRRSDGLFEAEATLIDTKSEPNAVTLGDGLLHQLSVRLVFDEDMTVQDVVASTDVTPYPACSQVVPGLQVLKGLSIRKGWSAAVRDRLAGAKGCTHLVELLGTIATVAFQTTFPVRVSRPDPLDAKGRPLKIDSCHAYSRHGELVLRRWPEHHEPAPSEGPTPLEPTDSAAHR